MAKSKRERRDLLVRVLAIVLAALLVGSIVFSVLPVFGLADEEPRSHYALDMAVDLDAQAIAVTETLDYVNATGRRLDAVWLTVYPNALRRTETVPVENSAWNDAFPAGYAPGGVDFVSVTVDGEAADWAMSGSGETFMRIGVSLRPGGTARIEMRFHLLLSENRWALGVDGLGWRLTDFFPMAAAYDAAAGDFILNSWTVAADPTVGDAADFEASLTLPETWLVASTGEATPAPPDGNGMVSWTIRAAARDFCLAFSRRMNERRGETACGTAVRAYASTGSAAQAMLEAALRAMNVYEGWFGPGAQGELELMETGFLRDGLARPGLIQISDRLTGLRKRGALEAAVMRLCAKQWFGGEVGCNTGSEPWLADAVSAYAALMAYEEKEGYGGYLKRLNAQVLGALQVTIPGGLTVDSAASRFDSVSEYELVVVDRGAAVLHEMRDLTGRETFIEGLARYVADNRGKIASIRQFAAAFNEVTGEPWDEYLVYQLHSISDYVNQRLTWFE